MPETSAEIKLASFASLPVGWNGSREPKPKDSVIAKLISIVSVARSVQLPESDPCPDVEGGACLYFFGGGDAPDGGANKITGLFLSNDGDLTLYLRDKAASRGEITELEDSEAAIFAALLRIKTFLGG